MIEDAIDRIVKEWKRQRPELDVSATEVLQRITRIYLLQAASFAEVFGHYGLTFGEYEVLAALRRSDPPHQMKPTELIAALVLSSGAVTNRIDQVEEAGLVRRLPDPDDRRGTLVRLTEGGSSWSTVPCCRIWKTRRGSCPDSTGLIVTSWRPFLEDFCCPRHSPPSAQSGPGPMAAGRTGRRPGGGLPGGDDRAADLPVLEPVRSDLTRGLKARRQMAGGR